MDSASCSREERPRGDGPAALAGAAIAAVATVVVTYAACPPETARAAGVPRLAVLAVVAALLGAAWQTLVAGGRAACRSAGRSRMAAVARIGVMVIAGWAVTGAGWDALRLGPGIQTVAELMFVPACLLGLWVAAWFGGRVAGARRDARDRIADCVLPAFAILCIALRSDMARFALWSPPVRVPLSGFLAGAVALCAALAAIDGTRKPVRVCAVIALGGLAAVLLHFDATGYRRLYPELHLAAWTAGVFAIAAIAARLGPDARGRRHWWTIPAALVVTAAASADDTLRAEIFLRAGPIGRVARVSGLWAGPWTIGTPEPRFEPGPAVAARPREPQPCVFLVSVDALRADRLTSEKMPATAAWAARGLRFDAARTVCPGTHQSLSGLLRGTYRQDDDGESGDGAAWAVVAAFRAAGYRTAAIGGLGRHDYVSAAFETTEGPPTPRDDAWSAGRFTELVREAAAGGPPVLAWLHLDRPHAAYLPSAPAPGASAVELYDACVRDTDALLTGVLAEIDRVASTRPVCVVLFADHGEEFGEHGAEYHLSAVYDVQVRIPLVLAGTQVAPGVRPEPVSILDLSPTLLEWAGLAVPEGFHGRSLVPALRGEAVPPRPVLSALVAPESGRTMCAAAVIGPWKLIADAVNGTLELYRVDVDPMERANQIGVRASAPRELFDALSLGDRR